jgi:hypothetical protein
MSLPRPAIANQISIATGKEIQNRHRATSNPEDSITFQKSTVTLPKYALAMQMSVCYLDSAPMLRGRHA